MQPPFKATHFDLLDAQRILHALWEEYPELRFWPKIAADIVMGAWQNSAHLNLTAEFFIGQMRRPAAIMRLGWLMHHVLLGDLVETMEC